MDAAAQRLIDQGVDPDSIEDAYMLSLDVRRRLELQSYVQNYVDHAISSTINIPGWGMPENNEDTVEDFGKILIKYLPHLRGITVYPEGSRGGQPLTPVPYADAIQKRGVEFEENGNTNACVGGVCGI